VTDETDLDQTTDPETDEVTTPSADDRIRQVTDFLEGARWFGGKGRDLRVTDVRRLGVIADDGPRVVVELAEVAYADGGAELYQMPLALYPEPEHRLDHAFVGWWEDPDIGWTHAYDAVHDREAMAAYLRAFAFPPDGPLGFRTLPGVQLDPTSPSTPLSAEQSNSSVMFGEEALLKVFRRITPGTNPDIEIHEVLTRAGSDNVAALLGWVECESAGGFETGAERPPQPPVSGAEGSPQAPAAAPSPVAMPTSPLEALSVLAGTAYDGRRGERATLLQFSSAFCAPCRATRRILEDVARAVPGVAHVEVDAEEHLDLVRALGVRRTPTTVVLDATGREVTRATGAPKPAQVLAALDASV
jgi:thiol-disulfide isomerase/thioredoxin